MQVVTPEPKWHQQRAIPIAVVIPMVIQYGMGPNSGRRQKIAVQQPKGVFPALNAAGKITFEKDLQCSTLISKRYRVKNQRVSFQTSFDICRQLSDQYQ